MDKPLNLSEYSNWLQMICVENVSVDRYALKLTERVEKIVSVRETLSHRVNEKQQKVKRLDEEIAQLSRDTQSVQDCLKDAESKYVKLLEENQSLKKELITQETNLLQFSKKFPDLDEKRKLLESERSNIAKIKGSVAESLDRNNVWDVLPILLADHDNLCKLTSTKWDQLMQN
ncbi:uncharacterized protein LOC131432818 [Malaya genurostris]|uniref:uncharacterized protein LOC131432818 n=1 Tax=Malaya genurostris TaxID=325434 RepID=UPI0026F3AB60|nr:uncharacterized protein LOC131432818 [Malaya genurostris]